MAGEVDKGRTPRIAYLCDLDPFDPNLNSGGNARLFNALRDHAGDVTVIHNGWGLAEPLRRLAHATPEAFNIRARWRLHLALAPLIARRVERQLAAGTFDVLFGAYSFQSLYRVRPPYPMVTAFTSDATPTIYKNSAVGQSFGSYFGPSRLLDPLIRRAEERTFRACDLLLWPSIWLKTRADTLYNLEDGRSLVVPWGANIDRPEPDPAPPRLDPAMAVRLLFVGRDWEAKGGPTTVDVLRALRARGVAATLTVVGCRPPAKDTVEGMTVHPQLDKSVPEQLSLFRQVYARSHFLVMPSRESWGFAFCEASAYGLPSLCLRIGGVPVRNSINGHALDRTAEATDFAEKIVGYLDAPGAYDDLRLSTRREYEERLNWDSWGRSVRDILAERVAALGAQQPVPASTTRTVRNITATSVANESRS